MPPEANEMLKDIRAWTQEKRGRVSAIAAALGVERQTVANWLNGRRTPRLVHWNDLKAYWAARNERAKPLDNASIDEGLNDYDS